MAFKLIYLARRNPRLASQEFPEAWRSHSRLAGTLAQTLGKHFLRSRQCIKAFAADVPPEYRNGHDGVALLTMRNWDSLVRARNHPDALRTMYDDEPRVFAGHVAQWTMAAEEVRLIEREEGAAALLHFFPRRADVDAYTFQDKWSGEYAETVSSLELVKSAGVFALNHVLDHPSAEYTFAGISEIWFKDVGSARAAAWDEGLRAATRSLFSVCHVERCVCMLSQLNFERASTTATS